MKTFLINANLVVALALQIYIAWSTYDANQLKSHIRELTKHRMPTINQVVPKSDVTT